MFLLHKKIKGISIKTDIKPIISNYNIEQLTKELISGNKIVITDIVLIHFNIILKLVGQYATRQPLEANNLLSDAYSEIIIQCNKLAKGEKKLTSNLTAFIIMTTHSQLARSLKRKKVEPLPNDLYKNHYQLYDLYSIIQDSIKNEQERQIIVLRSQSYNDREIADIIGLSYQRVAQIRKTVEKRFDRLMESK